MRVLCTGDLHIGRRSSKAPLAEGGDGFAGSDVWQDIVAAAIQYEVDLVAISGDIIDRSNRFLEAQGAFERGVQRLAGVGIQTVAVAGNHDWDSLSRLAESLAESGFRFVGARGRWERIPIVIDGVPRLWIEGWSFPEMRVETSPLAGHTFAEATDGLPLIGLLHADLDQFDSPYAPVSRAELERAPVSFWLLGHVHAPRLRDDGQVPLLYPGSPLAMDPGEPGPHGVWILDLAPNAAPHCKLVALSPIRYVTIDVDVSTVAGDLDFQSVVLEAVRLEVRQQSQSAGEDYLRFASIRVRLAGTTTDYGSLERWRAAFLSQFAGQVGGVEYAVDTIVNDARLALDLHRLAAGIDPPAILAQTILQLESHLPEDEAGRGLIERAVLTARDRGRHSQYEPVAADEPLDATAVKQILRQEAYRLLETLVSQKDVTVA